jgi:hypothetical protein
MVHLHVHRTVLHLQLVQLATTGGNGNGGTGAPGGIGGDSIGGDGGIGGDVFGGTGADGASACETTDSCFNDNGP